MIASGRVRLGSPPWPVRGYGTGNAGVRRLAGLRVGQLRRQQHVRVQAQVGERRVDERLHELPGNRLATYALKNGPDDTDSPSDIA